MPYRARGFAVFAKRPHIEQLPRPGLTCRITAGRRWAESAVDGQQRNCSGAPLMADQATGKEADDELCCSEGLSCADLHHGMLPVTVNRGLSLLAARERATAQRWTRRFIHPPHVPVPRGTQ